MNESLVQWTTLLGDLYDHWMGKAIFDFDSKIFISAPKITRKMAVGIICICNVCFIIPQEVSD